ncbi:MAG: aldo/keto reductase [Alphaproteobacteria bacterium]|nr:aldo/keto reductase [Alphaproteobacteria bacterium]
MRYVFLGGSGLRVSAIGLGGFAMAGFYGPADDAESRATLAEAIDLGVNFIDTADGYAGGRNEELIGAAIAGRRDQVVIATKIGNRRREDGTAYADGSPAYVADACERSLKRLGVATIDLLYLHRVDAATPIEDAVGAMARLVAAGKVRHLGLSEASAATIRRAHRVHPVAALQTEYSLWSRFAEAELLPTCRSLGIGYVAYSPLGRGFLTGTIRRLDDLPAGDWRRSLPRLQPDRLARNLTLVSEVEAVGRARGLSPAQIALAWVLARPEGIVPIPGTRNRRHLRENIGAAGIVLTADEIARLDQASDPRHDFGERLPEGEIRRVNL